MEQVTITKTGNPAILLEPKDLRIGNILLYKGEYVHVTALSMDIDDEYQETIGFCKLGKSTDEVCDWNRALCADLFPVTIEPEILKAVGFINKEVAGMGSDYVEMFLPMNEIEFGWDNQSNQLDLIGVGSTISIALDHIKYVHQLQNLYFGLIGNDFDFK